jgi:SAM-dependent methyltransferase
VHTAWALYRERQNRHHGVAMSVPPAFAPLAHGLRDEVIEHYERSGEPLDTPAGLRTLDTNSVLAPDRARLLLRLLAERGAGAVAGRRVLDLGAGFGALALYFAHLGAEVVAVDPNPERMQVALKLARRHGLALSTVTASAQSLPFADGCFDFVVANNSLCFILARDARRQALAEIHRVLRPGGWLAMRNPNRLHPRDQFTGLPLVGLLPTSTTQRVAARMGHRRSPVRLTSPAGAVLELRRAGFHHVRFKAETGRRARALIAGYHHVVAQRRPTAGDMHSPVRDMHSPVRGTPSPARRTL